MANKITKEVYLHQIIIDRLPINPSGLSTVIWLMNGGFAPPIHVAEISKGRYKICDGRHRYLAHKLLGKEKILVKYSIKD